jgi:hypothetical protein
MALSSIRLVLPHKTQREAYGQTLKNIVIVEVLIDFGSLIGTEPNVPNLRLAVSSLGKERSSSK